MNEMIVYSMQLLSRSFTRKILTFGEASLKLFRGVASRKISCSLGRKTVDEVAAPVGVHTFPDSIFSKHGTLRMKTI